VIYGAWFQVEDYVSEVVLSSGARIYNIWKGGWVFGAFNTATLKALEAKGLIKVHQFGGSHGRDEIEILA
jgi:hypothetical protein